MRDLIDRPEWVSKQYRSDDNLNARIAFHKRFSTSAVSWHHWVLDQVLDQLEPHAGQRPGPDGGAPLCVLEIGAGPAVLWTENRDRIPAHWHLIVSDLSPGMIVSAQRNLAEAGVRCSPLVAGAEQIPLASASCRAVVANHMLYHVANRTRALQEIRRMLMPGGVLFAATNGEGHLRELHDLAHRFDPSHPAEDPVPRRFSLQSGARELRDHFASVSVRHKENCLVVTEAEPLVAYLLSGSPAAIGPEQAERLRAFVENELAQRGPIHITPETGLLIARA